MKVYDLHVHSHMDDAGRMTPSRYLERLAEAGVYGSAVFSPGPGRKATDGARRLAFVLDYCKDQPGRLFPVFFISPHEDGAAELAKEAIGRGIAGFKIICFDHYVHDDKTMALLHIIAAAGKPVCFHSGILWNDEPSGHFNRPCNWEYMLHVPKLKFSMAHCSWPWIDECIALYGKIQHAYNNSANLCEMFFDLTPGTPVPYRRDLLTKLFTAGYDVKHNILFGTDCNLGDYSVEWTRKWFNIDNGLYEELAVNENTRRYIYEENFLRFFGAIDVRYEKEKLTSDGRK